MFLNIVILFSIHSLNSRVIAYEKHMKSICSCQSQRSHTCATNRGFVIGLRLRTESNSKIVLQHK
ncbi:hypothetical protein KC19_12G026600 [Ceratodon purpureus]|uniref:Secreted protein n=1 Tax=Ceratodon purpureus TaxID=3225 RepID=A0A8T0G5B4_CERPU|nr:hypothetical protein KC19_12G026600 [Ceratodon purpureus]